MDSKTVQCDCITKLQSHYIEMSKEWEELYNEIKRLKSINRDGDEDIIQQKIEQLQTMYIKMNKMEEMIDCVTKIITSK